jgi:2'-hydroxyisoflavone reductase
LAASFTRRGLRETVADTWEWMHSADGAVAHERSAEQGIAAEKEAAILGTWDACELDHCG